MAQNKIYLGGKEMSELLGVHQRTLYNWEKQGKIKTPGGKRLYNVRSIIKIKQKRICYVRVSTVNQRDDLMRQIEYMKKRYPNYEIIKDIGSGINFNRPGLNKIIEWAIEGRIKKIVVVYKDRLTRYGYELIEKIIKKYSGGKIKV
jgi:predicted site-specific integrase-resolvase